MSEQETKSTLKDHSKRIGGLEKHQAVQQEVNKNVLGKVADNKAANEKITDSQKWFGRLLIGAVVGGFISALIKLYLGNP